MSSRLLVLGAVGALLIGALAPSALAAGGTPAAGGAAKFTSGGQFVVQLTELPVVAYDGSIKGFKATKPAPGTKIDPASTDVVKYVGYLDGRHDTLLVKSGAKTSAKLYDYTYTYDGFSAKLTATQANRLAADPGVLAVTPNQRFDVDTSSTPTFLGLTDSNGLWAQLGGPTGTKTHAGAGENIVIADVDSGIWPESKSFSDRNASGDLIYANTPPSAFHGKCDGAAQVIDPTWDASRCNKKLVGARHFNASWGGNAALEAARPWEFQSPRDYNGHGTHTASTAGGNNGVAATGPAAVFGNISGMAPRARIAAYKALWSTEAGDTASGFTADLVAAIDQAVADGADVINYSVSGTSTNFLDPVEVSYLFAAQAGIFVSESAGNSGPTTGTVAHPSPWTTTVAAGTHNRNGAGSVTLGNNVTYYGASVATAVGPAPLINSTAAGAAGSTPEMVRQCFSTGAAGGTPQLDPALVSGKIVVCERGGVIANARIDKSLAVQEAGGVGMILINIVPNSLNADFHYVPTVHLADTDRVAVETYAAGVNPTATINQATIVYNVPAPFTASFSSRGPLAAGGGDILKPDVIAPGQDILAAVSPSINGRDFDLLSGTSMSAPHVSGVGALLKQLHPTWSVAMIKSALMTSAYDVLDSTSTVNMIFRQGAGHIKPNSAADPGLLYNNGFSDWLAFLKGQGICGCGSVAIDASDLNLASIAIGDLAGIQTVTRTVTNATATAAAYNASVSGMSGITTVVTPSTINVPANGTASFTVSFTRTTAALNAYVGGQLTWTQTSGGSHVVRSPIVVKPVAIAAPSSKTFTTASGPGNWNVKVGYAGQLNASAYGAAADVTSAEVVLQDIDQEPTTDPFDPTKGTNFYEFSLTSANPYWAGGTEAATTEAGSDLDVYLYRDPNADNDWSDAVLVAQSADGDSEEIVQLVHPTAGTYRLVVHGWGTPDGASSFTLHRWTVGGSADLGSLEAHAGSGDPATVAIGDTVAITLNWSGLTTGTQYRGVVDYDDGTNRLASTVVLINP
jgi:subtilisin family serine protease